MFGLWLAGSFAVWLLAGYGTWRFGMTRLSRLFQSRNKAALAAASLLFGSAGMLLDTLAWLDSASSGTMVESAALALMTLLGVVFVALQVCAVLLLLPHAVTNRPPPASIIENPEGMDS